MKVLMICLQEETKIKQKPKKHLFLLLTHWPNIILILEHKLASATHAS